MNWHFPVKTCFVAKFLTSCSPGWHAAAVLVLCTGSYGCAWGVESLSKFVCQKDKSVFGRECGAGVTYPFLYCTSIVLFLFLHYLLHKAMLLHFFCPILALSVWGRVVCYFLRMPLNLKDAMKNHAEQLMRGPIMGNSVCDTHKSRRIFLMEQGRQCAKLKNQVTSWLSILQREGVIGKNEKVTQRIFLFCTSPDGTDVASFGFSSLGF